MWRKPCCSRQSEVGLLWNIEEQHSRIGPFSSAGSRMHQVGFCISASRSKIPRSLLRLRPIRFPSGDFLNSSVTVCMELPPPMIFEYGEVPLRDGERDWLSSGAISTYPWALSSPTLWNVTAAPDGTKPIYHCPQPGTKLQIVHESDDFIVSISAGATDAATIVRREEKAVFNARCHAVRRRRRTTVHATSRPVTVHIFSEQFSELKSRGTRVRSRFNHPGLFSRPFSHNIPIFH